jgi:hypothetical protein
MFAGIVTPSDDPMIPQLDLLACDFYRDKAYPSYLYYNPYDERRQVSVRVGDAAVDIYDAVRNAFVARNVTGSVKVPLDADSAAVLVLAPAGGKESYDGRKTRVDGVVIDFDNGRAPRPQPMARPEPADQSKPVAADRANIVIDGDPNDWATLASEMMRLNTGGRGKLEAELRFAWDEQFLYVLAKQTAKAEKVNEAADKTAYAAAPWDFDGVWLHVDMANGRIPTVGEFIVALALNSSGAANLFNASDDAGRVESATSGTHDAGNRVIEARIAWSALIGFATNNRPDFAERLGGVAPGFRFGCDPMLIEYNHTRQSFIGGAHYAKPTGRDANSRDIVLREKPDRPRGGK